MSVAPVEDNKVNDDIILPNSPTKSDKVAEPTLVKTTGNANGKFTEGNDDEDDVEQIREKNRQKEPLFYCKLITKYPKTAFSITLSLHLLMLLIMASLFLGGYDILPINFESLPLDIKDNQYYLRGLSWDYRNQDEVIIKRGSTGESNFTERTQILEQITLLFQEENGNVLTKKNLQAIKAVEDELFQLSKFQASFCHASQNGTCYSPVSVSRFFDGTYGYVDPAFNDPNFDNVVDVLYKASFYNETKALLNNVLAINSTVTSNSSVSPIIRTFITLGSPLRGYINATDRESEQTSKIEEFLGDDFIVHADKHFKNGIDSMSFNYNSETILQVYIRTLVFLDLSLAGGSFCFIFFFMWFQTRSLWITGFSVLSVLTGFCATNIVYRIPLDFRYFGIFHVLALFIILGIGADDVFVFFDTWKESGHHIYKSLSHRLSDCYRRASLAMLYTSLTTAVAFIVSATSPFLAVNSFGVFAGILVLVNYLSVIIYFPCVVVMYHLYFEKYKCCCCCTRSDHIVGMAPTHSSRKNVIVRFFKGPYFKFVTHRIFKWFILSFYAVLLAVFIYFATQLKVNEEQIKFLPDDSNLGQFLRLRATDFSTGELPRRLFIVFGLKKQDLSVCHRTDSLCFGNTVWDDNFNLDTQENQQAILDFCNKIKTLSSTKVDELKIKKNLITGDLEVNCFIEDLQNYLNSNTNVSSSLPINQTTAVDVMNSAPNIYNASLLGSTFSSWFEIVCSHWLYDSSITSTLKSNYLTYDPLIGESTQASTVNKVINGVHYKYGNKLKYFAIIVNTTINPRTTGFPVGIPIREAWETFVSEEIAKMPPSLQSGFQSTPLDYWGFDLWHWMDIQQTLSSSAVTGVIVGLCLALPILIIATMNIFVGLLATVTICCITISVIGVIPMAGWKLGLLESLNLVLVVGLAVDYCVHLAEGYSRSVHTDREGRLHDALEEVGISVLSGCCTTLGASLFLLFAQILFFTQFGVFMFCTIGFSILYALGFFITVLGVIGPQNNIGSLKYLWKKCRGYCKSKDSSLDTDTKESVKV